jgi:hypothetical protein
LEVKKFSTNKKIFYNTCTSTVNERHSHQHGQPKTQRRTIHKTHLTRSSHRFSSPSSEQHKHVIMIFFFDETEKLDREGTAEGRKS